MSIGVAAVVLELDKSHLAFSVPFPLQSPPLEISHGLLLRRRSVVHPTSLWYLSAFSILILVIPTHHPLFRLNHTPILCFVNFIIENHKNNPTDPRASSLAMCSYNLDLTITITVSPTLSLPLHQAIPP